MEIQRSPFFKLISDRAAEYPAKVAVSYNGSKVTYSDLNRRINQLAHYLKDQNVSPGDRVAVAVERTTDMLVALIAILKAGAAYIPIDPLYPQKRIEYMLDDSSAKLLLTTNAYIDQFSASYIRKINLDGLEEQLNGYSTEDPPVAVTGKDLAYIIYTSGSTGKPKGIAIEHHSLTNFLLSMKKLPGISSADKLLAVTTVSFDISALELYLPLTTGAELVLADSETSKDGRALLKLLNSEDITIMQATPSGWRMMLEAGWNGTPDLKALCGGEALSKDLADLLLPKCRELWNMYGPTETTIWSTVKQIKNTNQPITIGHPIDNTKVYILNEAMENVPDGDTGEIYIAGEGLAREYLNQPELTASAFLNNPFDEGTRIYKTGDLGKRLPHGEIQCFGRLDNQVKILGHRVELGAIEDQLNKQDGVKESFVTSTENASGHPALLAYVIPESNFPDSSNEFSPDRIRIWSKGLQQFLPDYMIPATFVRLKKLPLLPNGKIDRHALPLPIWNTENIREMYKAPVTATEALLCEMWSYILKVDKVGTNDNFFELGGNSLLAIRFVSKLEDDHQFVLPVTRLYQFPFIEKIASILDGKEKPHLFTRQKKAAPGNDVAIVGMSGRFPGANTIDQFWDVIRSGKETTSFFTEAELDGNIPESLKADPNYIKARGIIDHADQFDAAFFGINHRLAEIMDPQQRIFLEICWEALESTGYLPDKFPGKVGVFAGSGSNTYFLNNIYTRPDITAGVGHFQVSTLNDKDYLAMRIAYELDLKGPAVSVYSSSSTSLLAIAQAVESLRQGQCELALAGGITITSPIKSGHLYEEGAMFSEDGHCRPFDASASGTVFSDGAGVVLLKPLESAERDGDTIYAVLKGVGLNNDGSLKASFTAPHAEGQADAINMAINDAGIDPTAISYVEAHGTATPIGDPIEIEGLKLAFGESNKKQYCAIGSLKSNMGHLTHAAGVAGVIKTVLALQNKQIPPSLFFNEPNPEINFANSPFFVNTKLINWNSDGLRRAGVSSFGIGGTNVHVILEEYPAAKVTKQPADRPYLIKWSAKNKSSLNNYGDQLAAYLIEHPGIHINDIAFTLQQTRSDFFLRRYIIASDTQDLINKLNLEAGKTDIKVLSESATDVAFMFPGQGSQYPTMGIELYEKEPIYKRAVDECAIILEKLLDRDIREILYSSGTAAGEDLNHTRFTQPALFVTEYAMASLWKSWGIKPAALTGHSIGEFVAAHLAGIFTLEDVLKVVSERARLISRLPGGSMLAIKITQNDLQLILPDALSIAAINSPSLCVVSGPTIDIESFSETLPGKGIASRLINTSHAFHSSMMDGIKEEFGAVMKSVKLSPPRVPLVSTVTGKWMSEAEAMNPDYWINQLRLPVRFADALASLWEDPNRLLLEVGPGNAATIFARDLAKGTSQIAVPGFGIKEGARSEYADVLSSLGKIWQNGIVPDWSAVSSGRKIKLPTYAFDRRRCWIEPGTTTYTKPAMHTDAPAAESLSSDSLPEIQLSRKELLIKKIKLILENASGIEMAEVDTELNFIEIGLDSLLLTQIAITLKKEFSVPVSFRQLNESLNTINRLADYLDAGLPEDASQSWQNTEAEDIGKQIRDLNQQLVSLKAIPAISIKINTEGLSKEELEELSKPFGASPKIETQSSELNPHQAEFLKDLTEKYTSKTKASKAYTQQHRPYMADPRVVSGFRPQTKELVYPIVAKYSKGSKIRDLDGNEYIDALNGFGSNMLGYQPDILVKAIKDQMDRGYEIGPQHELAADVCRLICEFTNFDRAAICSTGSEAVMGTMRIARTVTGRSLIVAFSGSYHGIFDEVLVRGTKTFRSVPAAAGIMPEAVENMLILDYGTDETLKIIRERAHELAAVLVEPIQSRRPDFQPIEFLRQVRQITERSGTALIFDEVITGFRMHPGGTQALFNIKADIASYGKVIGGGLPIGIIAGTKSFMDALDGGYWQYGDSSAPEVGVTYFAGTFVRHPLALIAAKTSLEYFKQRGPALQQDLNNKSALLMDSMNKTCKELRVPLKVVGFGSLWRVKFTEDVPYNELLFTLMRYKGIHILDGFPCFITESHTYEELRSIADAFKESLSDLITAGFLLPDADKSVNFVKPAGLEVSPIAGAKLGRDRDGNPAWFIEDPEQPGKYMQVNLRK